MKIVNKIVRLIVILFLVTAFIAGPVSLLHNAPVWLISYGKFCEGFWIGIAATIMIVFAIEMCVLFMNCVRYLFKRNEK